MTPKMKTLLMIPVFMFVAALSYAQVTVQDDITADQTWTADNEYFLDGLIFVHEGVSLTIEAGTVVKGLEQNSITTGDGASALIVRRGARIYAEGCPTAPIIFTSELDDISDPFDLGPTDRRLWGGVILLGRATTNEPTTDNQVEGVPSNEDALYGGNDDDDNSGIFRYVSIRHGGFSISGVPGDEINGLTMGAVGRGTTIDHVEVYANFDDGFEWFGGTVNTSKLVAAFCGDDGFDYDQGFRGKGQFWFAIQAADEAGRGGEHDGGDTNETGMPFATPYVINATYIGSGATATPGGDGNNHSIIFRDNAGGHYYNSIFTEYTGDAFSVEDLPDTVSAEDSRARLEAGDLSLGNNLLFAFGAGATEADIVPQDFVRNSPNYVNNQIVDPQLSGVSRTNDGTLDPRPDDSGPAGTGSATFPAPLAGDPFFKPVTYKGAFDPQGSLWVNGWSALYQNGHLVTDTPQTVTVADNVSGATTWKSTNTYLLDGLIFVEAGATLTIEPGAVIKGLEQNSITTGDGASALIVRRNAQIWAEGEACAPIVFTSELDDVNDPLDLGTTDRGLWGGVIVLGNATTNEPTTDNQVEGVPSNEDALYGGNDDNDNSGVLRYISIRHGGFSISGVPGDEINGLTMGAVGDATTIDHVEVFANFDDTRYLVAAFCGDDGFDYDQGFRGKGQFWFVVQGADEAGRGGEHDGGDTNETGQPFAIPEVWNATYIGSGATATPGGDGNNHAIIFRDNAGGKYYNSIFTEYAGDAFSIEDLDPSVSLEDSRARLEAGDLVLSNNILFSFGAGATEADIVPQEFVRTSPNFVNNQIVDPQLNSVSRSNNMGLDPRPSANGPAGSVTITADDPFFSPVDYRGAFDPNAPLWTTGWTALFQDEITNVRETVDEGPGLPRNFALTQNYPNPFNPTTNINFSVPAASHVTLTVFNMVGQKVATLVDGVRAAGTYTISWDASNLSSGIYVYRLEAGDKVFANKMTLIK